MDTLPDPYRLVQKIAGCLDACRQFNDFRAAVVLAARAADVGAMVTACKNIFVDMDEDRFRHWLESNDTLVDARDILNGSYDHDNEKRRVGVAALVGVDVSAVTPCDTSVVRTAFLAPAAHGDLRDVLWVPPMAAFTERLLDEAREAAKEEFCAVDVSPFNSVEDLVTSARFQRFFCHSGVLLAFAFAGSVEHAGAALRRQLWARHPHALAERAERAGRVCERVGLVRAAASDLDDFVGSRFTLPQCPRDCTPMPYWWCSQQGYVSLKRALEARHYFIQRILKVSAHSVVMACSSTCVGDGGSVRQTAVKLYCSRPTAALDALERARRIADKQPPGTGCLAVVEDFSTPVGHCVVFPLLAQPPQVHELSLGERERIVLQVQQLLQHFHTHKLYHGDVHRDNVSVDAVSGAVTLLDFDCARDFSCNDDAAADLSRAQAELLQRDHWGLQMLAVQLDVQLGVV